MSEGYESIPNGYFEPAAKPCPECQNKTIKMRGQGFDIQVWVCSRKDEPGHLSRQEAEALFQDYKRKYGPIEMRWA